jgi:2-phosphosulfolactate phosphatase
MKIETLLSPAELPALAHRDLTQTVCVVFDILRATTTFVTALNNGAAAIIPACEIAEALAFHKKNPRTLLAGERDGVKIHGALSGGREFDFGNSPREFTPERVHGQTIASTTTNGTRALRACAGAKAVLAASFLNLQATADFLKAEKSILLVCAGTGTDVSLEDVLAAGALVELLAARVNAHPTLTDASLAARHTFWQMGADLTNALGSTANGRRLLGLPDLRADVAFCAQRDIFNFVVALNTHGALQKL